jgi:hypothetical protein
MAGMLTLAEIAVVVIRLAWAGALIVFFTLFTCTLCSTVRACWLGPWLPAWKESYFLASIRCTTYQAAPSPKRMCAMMLM